MMRTCVFIAAGVFLLMAACATVGVSPVVVQGNRIIDADAVRPVLGKLDMRCGMMDAQAFKKAMEDQRKVISGDKGITEEQRAKELRELNGQSFVAGQWWWAQFVYEKKPEKGAFSVLIFDTLGENLIGWSFGSTTRYSSKMNVGKDVVESVTFDQKVVLKTKVPLTRQNIALDRSPIVFRITALKDNRVVSFIIPR